MGRGREVKGERVREKEVEERKRTREGGRERRGKTLFFLSTVGRVLSYFV